MATRPLPQALPGALVGDSLIPARVVAKIVGGIADGVHQEPNAGKRLSGINVVVTQQERVQIGVCVRAEVESPSEKLFGDITVAVVRYGVDRVPFAPKEAA